MANRPKKKFFYHIDEVCDRLGLSLLDMSVLVTSAPSSQPRADQAYSSQAPEGGPRRCAYDGSAATGGWPVISSGIAASPLPSFAWP